MMRQLLFMGAVLLLPLDAAGQFSPTKEPVSPEGVRAICDIPPNLHMRNTGGMGRGGPGTGSGLCVWTSLEVAARWQNLPEIAGLQRWMTFKEGGGYPQKVDKLLPIFCKEKGVVLPPYIQHTGSDETFLDLAIKTDRMVCVTYSGSDDFYRSGVDHMVVLAHIDQKVAAIYDNNRPQTTVWMSRTDFIKRWKARGGGWAFVWLTAPPPPYVADKKHLLDCPCPDCKCDTCPCPTLTTAPSKCICGDNCKCKPGDCPGKCPVQVQCPNGRCSPIQVIPPSPFFLPSAPILNPKADVKPIGTAPSDRHEWGMFPDGQWGWRFKKAIPVAPELKLENAPEPKAVEKDDEVAENYGVDRDKIHSGERYTLSNGQEISKGRAHALVAGNGLVDDSHRWHLTVVGDDAFQAKVKAHLDALKSEQKEKLLVQYYAPDHWTVSRYSLPNGVSLRKPSPVRTSEEVGVIPPAEYTLERFLLLLLWLDGQPKPPVPPLPPVPPSPPPPNVQPAPDTPVNPLPVTPSAPLSLPALLLMLGALYLLLRKKETK
jgi:hypothetical protein